MAVAIDHGTLLATIPKTPWAEVRLHRTHHAGRTVLDLRVWFIPKGRPNSFQAVRA